MPAAQQAHGHFRLRAAQEGLGADGAVGVVLVGGGTELRGGQGAGFGEEFVEEVGGEGGLVHGWLRVGGGRGVVGKDWGGNLRVVLMIGIMSVDEGISCGRIWDPEFVLTNGNNEQLACTKC